MPRDVMEEIRNEVATHPVLIYMKGTKDFPQCGFSARAAGILGALGVPFTSVDVLSDQEKWQAVKEFSEWPTIPQIYIGGQFVGGGDQLRELEANGELRKLVDAAVAKG